MKFYRVRHLVNNSVKTLNEDDWQAIKGAGWGKRYVVEEVTAGDVKSGSFRPPSEVKLISVKIPDEVKTETQEQPDNKPSGPKKEENANA